MMRTKWDDDVCKASGSDYDIKGPGEGDVRTCNIACASDVHIVLTEIL